jgi:hypothetical protein
MTHKAITLKFVVRTAVTLGILLSIAAVYLKDKYFQINQAEASFVAGRSGIVVLPNSDGRFSRIHLLLSSMK